MTAYTWVGATGDWNVSTNWSPSSPAGPPTASDSATISATGPAYTVTIDSAAVAKSLTEKSASATVDDIGSLTLSGTLALSAGTFILGPGGTLSGGTTKVTSGTFVCDGGTLSGAIFDGPLSLSGSSASVHLAKGTVVNNAAGTGPGTINDTGVDTSLYFDNAQTFNNATINLGNVSYYDYLYSDDVSGAGSQVLTLGSGVTIDVQGYAEIYGTTYSGDGIVDKGVINDTTAGDRLTIAGNAFTNAGTITDTASGGSLTIESNTFTNQGTITVENDQTVTVQSGTTFNNSSGTISVDGTSAFVFDDALTAAQLGTVNAASGATLDFSGGLNNTGATLKIAAGVLLEGTINGGTIDGTINFGASTLTFSGGPTVDNAAGTGPGTINDTGVGTTLYFDNTQTFNKATINLGNVSYYDYLYSDDVSGAGSQVLTLGSGVTIDVQGYAEIYGTTYSGDGIVNKGVINDTTAGDRLIIAGNAFTNAGTIADTASGGSLTIESNTFTNQGTITVKNGQTLTVPGGTTFNNSSGTISVDGTSALVFDDALTAAQLGTVNAASGATLDFSGGLNNTGATLKIAAGVLLEGTINGGTIDGTINFGASTLTFSGGPTVDNAAGTGPGTINDTGVGTTLYFDNTQTFNKATINLGNVSYYDYLYSDDVSGAGGQVLTLGSGVTIDVQGYAEIYGTTYSGDGIVNKGVINDTTAGDRLIIAGNAFTNAGTIADTASGGSLTIESNTFTNQGTITVKNGQTLTVPGGTTFNNSSGTISVDGTSALVFDDALTAAQLGTVNAASGATLDFSGGLNNTGATLKIAAGVLLEGTINGGTIDGTINFGASTLTFSGGPTVDNAAGTGPGTINDTGVGTTLYFDNTQTFNKATINLGNVSYYDYLYSDDVSGAGGQVLTLGSGVTIDVQGYAEIYGTTYSGDGIVNKGVINDTTAGDRLIIAGNAFTNAGTITDTASGGSLTIESNTFTNQGTITVENDQTVTVQSGTTFNNSSGTISVDGTSAFVFDDALTAAQLGTVNAASGATLDFSGGLNNTGATLKIAAGVLLEGTINGGTIDGTINFGASTLTFSGGPTVDNAAGTGPGTINDTGVGTTLYFDNTQTFNKATINLGNVSYYDYLYSDDVSGAGSQVLTLGSGVTIDVQGYAEIYGTTYSGDGIVNKGVINDTTAGDRLIIAGNAFTNAGTIADTASGGSLTIDSSSLINTKSGALDVSGGGSATIDAATFTNQGTITAASSGGTLIIEPTTFTNSGTLAVSNGDTVDIEPTTFTNLSGTTLTGGAYSVGAGSVLELADNATITIDDANITLSGKGSLIQSYNTTTGAQQSFDSTIRTIGKTGQLHLLAKRSLTTAAAMISDNGLIQLGGGTLKVTGTGSSLTIGATGELEGFGVVNATTLTNSGLIEASGGTLTVQNAVKGTGGLQIDAKATLVLGGSTASGVSATFDGADATLTLNKPASFAGKIGGFGLDDTIALVGVTANEAKVNASNQLVVTDNGTTVDTLQLSGINSGFYFLPVGVSGGTDIFALPIPATVADYLDVPSLYDDVSGGFAISDTAANVSASLGQLDDSHISSITATSGSVVVSVSTFSADQSTLDKIVGGFDVSDTAANVVAGLSTLNADSHVAVITVTGGSATLSGGVAVNVPNFSETGSGTSLTVGEVLAYTGDFSQGAGSTNSISSADKLSLTGTASLSGTTSGAGTLALSGGSATIASGAMLSISHWSISGAGTDVTLGENLNYAGSFSEAANDTFVLSGGNLLLNGADTFSGGMVDGSKLLETEGTTTVSGLTIGGTVEWENTKTVTQTGGTVTIGDSSGDEAFLDNTATGTYDIAGASAVGRGSSTASYIKNAGLFEQTGGTGTSTIAPAVTNTGTLKVTSGTLDFEGAVTGTGTDAISGASTLEFGSAVSSSTTVGSQNIGFTGDGTLDLTDPTSFYGEVSGFAAGDTVQLLGSWAFSGFSENSGGTLATLTLMNGTTTHVFEFVGDYAKGDFKITSGATSTITYT